MESPGGAEQGGVSFDETVRDREVPGVVAVGEAGAAGGQNLEDRELGAVESIGGPDVALPGRVVGTGVDQPGRGSGKQLPDVEAAGRGRR